MRSNAIEQRKRRYARLIEDGYCVPVPDEVSRVFKRHQ